MKPVIIGSIIGSAVGLFLSTIYLYSLWLPVTAIAILISGAIGSGLGCRIKPVLIVSAVLFVLYFGIFWVPPEWKSGTASTPEEHFSAARAIGNRAQLFGAHERSVKHYQLAAEGGHPEATYIMAAYYDFGYNGFPRNKAEAISHYRRASELGYEDGSDRLRELTK